MNELSGTVLVMPITSGHYPYYHLIALRVPEGGLSKPSSIVTDQIRSVDKRRFVRRTGVVSQGTITRIEQAIRDPWALPEGGVVSE